MQVLKEDIRDRILAIARQQFAQNGYSKTSMREIAGLAGVGVGNIYNYFANKDELFREVVRAGASRHTGRGYYDDAVGKVSEVLHR